MSRLTVVTIKKISNDYGYSLSNSIISKIYNDLSSYNEVDLNLILDELEWWNDKQKEMVV